VSSSKITINDVAREAGVSIATISRFLNNPSRLKIENRKKVEEAIKKLNYKPHVYARRLAGGKLGVFGLIIPGYEGIFYSFYAMEIIRGVGFSLEKMNIDLHLHIFWNRDRFNTSLVDGVIFADIIGNEKQLKRILKEKIPCVVINKRIEEPDLSFVAIDNFKGAYQAVEFLIQYNHKKIAHLVGDLKTQCAQERLQGYKSALEKNNIPIKDSYIKLTNFSRIEARKSVEELLSLSDPPTAIFAASDDMAMEVFNFAQKEGIKIPKELSIVGFDDNPMCMYESLRLTTVRQPLFKMASLGVEILKDLIEKKEVIKRKIVLSPELVVGDSVTFL
jgi:DNA-binding LacI/PurR family transcriptional regulator